MQPHNCHIVYCFIVWLDIDMNTCWFLLLLFLAKIDLPFFYFLECSCGAKQQTNATSGYITMWRDVEPNVHVLLTFTLSHKKWKTLEKMCCVANIIFDVPILYSSLSFKWNEQTTLVFVFNLSALSALLEAQDKLYAISSRGLYLRNRTQLVEHLKVVSVCGKHCKRRLI